MDKFYCGQCDRRRTSHVVEREIELQVIDEPIKINARVRICDECGGECYDEELEEALFRKAYDIYRQHHNLITPEQLKAIREKYGLSQRSLAALLGWGEVTVHRYENGSLPDEAHNQLLHLLKYPENMLRIAEMNGTRLPAASRRKLYAKLEEIFGEIKAIKQPRKTASKKTPARQSKILVEQKTRTSVKAAKKPKAKTLVNRKRAAENPSGKSA
jgi:putative zinc finger/helix-turn-helix YgiT family protein